MSIRILIADDALFMRKMLKKVFSGDEFEVAGEAANGFEAVAMYKKLQPDITTMDIVMPLKNGIDAIREIFRIDNRAKVIVCSAFGQETLILEAIEAGAANYVIKPFTREKILDIVRETAAH